MSSYSILKWAIVLGTVLFLLWHTIESLVHIQKYGEYLIILDDYLSDQAGVSQLTEHIFEQIKVYMITLLFSYGLFSAIDYFFLKDPSYKVKSPRKGLSLSAYIYCSIVLGILFHSFLSIIFVFPIVGLNSSLNLLHYLMAFSLPTAIGFILLWPLKRKKKTTGSPTEKPARKQYLTTLRDCPTS